MKKFILTDDTTTTSPSGPVLYRIQALVAFGDVAEGELGGYIEKEENLSHEGTAWVSCNAEVYDNAKVFGNAKVYGDAEVSGDAWVSGNAKVSGDAKVSGNAEVYGNAKVSGDAKVSGNT